mmetsp:Transcript_25454/g.39155  ORF Transcript_25454/g.39155 Transcript_25454/m.39155 type:complete len:322 (-) Transcript_25454:546-1511(-)|eukprot:CAMPEP_0195298288 /NCGR_PEP_ID=MMETSP0707-20130614/23187_1 /TAXON_ID=33640 /ORGANISM="Asterionellopsis glacialis, Strain CCMP134" /LENGTH=321 /DNA_ID=CAMNT_0040360341 /DNA_START=83 /DNA_END=1048 /DNA_ORIENTATION=+
MTIHDVDDSRKPQAGNFCNLQDQLDGNLESEAALLDKYGGGESTRETPNTLQDALAQLEEELDKITENREAFDLAQITCPEYAQSTNFRLMFLRSTEFDAKAAAEKQIKYWSRKVELFGLGNAFRRLSLRDFEDEDEIALSKGGVRALPEKDDAGRAMILSFRDLWDNRRSHRKSMLRLIWYMMHFVFESDVSVQQNGIVIIVVNTMPSYQISGYDDKINRMLWRDLQYVIPVKVKATHAHFGTNIFMKLIKNTMTLALNKTARSRYYYLDGCTVSTFCASLEEYGIGLDKVPTIIGGEAEFNYQEWLQQQQELIAVDENN